MTDHPFVTAYMAAYNRDQPAVDQIAALEAFREYLESEGLTVHTKWSGDPNDKGQPYDVTAPELRHAMERLERGK